jgi:hypothetical protein
VTTELNRTPDNGTVQMGIAVMPHAWPAEHAVEVAMLAGELGLDHSPPPFPGIAPSREGLKWQWPVRQAAAVRWWPVASRCGLAETAACSDGLAG